MQKLGVLGELYFVSEREYEMPPQPFGTAGTVEGLWAPPAGETRCHVYAGPEWPSPTSGHPMNQSAINPRAIGPAWLGAGVPDFLCDWSSRAH